MLDDLIDANRYVPSVPGLEKMAKLTRRIGTGITGLADMLILLDLHYDSPEARGTAAQVVEWILYNCMKESIRRAGKGASFPLFKQSVYASDWQGPILPIDYAVGYQHPPINWPDPSHGIRNCGLTVIGPGSFGSQTMSTEGFGCEPVFASAYMRSLSHTSDQGYTSGLSDEPCFVTALELSPRAHVEMVACLQPFVTESISKTINVPFMTTLVEISDLIMMAWQWGLKGFTSYRLGSREKEVLCPVCQVVDGGN